MLLAAAHWEDIEQGVIDFAFIAVLGGGVGLLWGALRHRRELDLAALADFRDAYGRWCAVWRGWSAAMDAVPKAQRVAPIPVDMGVQQDLVRRAADIEGVFEALLVKIATERKLSPDEIRRLGRFREGYQQLRESIEHRREVPFRVQYHPDNVNAYLAFKALSVEFASLLSQPVNVFRPSTWRRPSLENGQESFVQATSWRPLVGNDHGVHEWWGAHGNDELRADLLRRLHELRL
jgi:hypothetical protein